MEPFIAQIIMFGGNFSPRGWAYCNGTLLSISQYQALFSLLGTTYGGDGRTTFALPDLRGRVPIHPGTGPGLPTYQLGQQGGQYQLQLGQAQLPTHSHTINSNANKGDSNTPTNKFISATEEVQGYHSSNDGQLNSGAVNNTGNGQAFNSMPPFLGVNYIIALTGTFPSRN